MARTFITVNLQYEAIHRWEGCDIPEVIYLQHYHRHIFHIKCKKEVKHDDRDIEIICFKNEILAYLSKYKGNFENMSCEMIARELVHIFDLSYCEVLEDGENGAEITT